MKFATLDTPHQSTRIYVDPENIGVENFLKSVCLWGGHDHEINGYVGYEVKRSIVGAISAILMLRFDMKFTPDILH